MVIVTNIYLQNSNHNFISLIIYFVHLIIMEFV